jgi:glycerol-3-phosphate dehydrogenase (NAD(P)+)
VVGGGAFGWGLALAAERAGREVLMWSRRPQREASSRVSLVGSLAELAAADLVFFAVPSPVMPELAAELGRAPRRGALPRAREPRDRRRGADDAVAGAAHAHAVSPGRGAGGAAGGRALIERAPGGGVVASRFPEVKAAVREALGGKTLRIYRTDDVIGAEFASTAVGLLAMAVGYARGIGLGPATLAVMASRGMAECARIGVHLGGRAETFAGLAGHGDLLAAVAGDGRPELAVGRELAAGTQLADSAGTRRGLRRGHRERATDRRVRATHGGPRRWCRCAPTCSSARSAGPRRSRP